jgi:hypothetical protein
MAGQRTNFSAWRFQKIHMAARRMSGNINGGLRQF